MDINEVMGLKTSIEKAQLEKANLEGQIDSILKDLKEKYGINDIDSIDNYIITMDAEIVTMNEELQTKMKELEDELTRNKK